ncbi:MAG: CarD family transcriptional regulator [Anaerolineae bacterium]
MFEIGDAVVHPAKGAGIITDVRRMPGLRKRLQCYKIKMVDERAKTVLMIPIEKAADAGLRPATSKASLGSIWKTLAAVPQELPAEHKTRYKLLKEKLKTGNVTQVAEVIRDLAWRRITVDKKKLNMPGQRIYDKAMRLLSGELAVTQEISVQTAKVQVEDMLEKSLEPAAV